MNGLTVITTPGDTETTALRAFFTFKEELTSKIFLKDFTCKNERRRGLLGRIS